MLAAALNKHRKLSILLEVYLSEQIYIEIKNVGLEMVITPIDFLQMAWNLIIAQC